MLISQINVQVPDKHYPIQIGRGLIAQASLYPAAAREGRAFVVTNETVAPLYLDQLHAALGKELPVHVLADGEQFKSMQSLNRILDAMLSRKLARDTVMIALGGGVIGDLAGFAAAIFQRGIALVQIPTTLLSQVDSSVGGKTAVNHPLGKNMIGAFHQPDCVITDLDTLDSLPTREFSAGLAEIIKYGLIGDASFLDWLEHNIPALIQRDNQALSHAISTSCKHKARVVAADEREKGQRALLNLGHTFGHAIEAHLEYKGWLHGEAVGVGMLMAADLSMRHGWISPGDVQRVHDIVNIAELPTKIPDDLGAKRMLELMQGDKKVAAGRVRLVLMRQMGEAFLSTDYEDQLLQQTLEEFCACR